MTMSPELIAILAVGVALAGLVLQGQSSLGRRLDKRMDGLEVRMDGLDKRMDRLEGRMDRLEARMDSLDERLRAVEAAIAEIKGQLTIVRDYIAGRNTRPDDPQTAPAE